MYIITPTCYTNPFLCRWYLNSDGIPTQFKLFIRHFGTFHGLRPLLPTTYCVANSLSDRVHNRHPSRKKKNFALNTCTITSHPPISSRDISSVSLGNSLTSQPHVAILGGGISGLATAYYLNRKVPNINITLYESKNRLGGWLETHSVDVGNGNIVLESGPRTLRYGATSSLVTAEIIQDLGLEDQLILTAKNSIAAKKRYIYYPDHLVSIPTSGENFWEHFYRLFTEPLFEGFFSAFLEFTRPSRAAELEDESVKSFFSRRLGGDHLVDNIHSAIIHGIYGGDINQLSIRSLFPTLWYMEQHFGGLLRGIFFCAKNKVQLLSPSDFSIRKDVYPKIRAVLHERLRDSAVFSFKQGIESLSRALENKIRAAPNVELRMNKKVKSIQLTDNGVEIQTSEGNPVNYAHVVSSLLPHQTSSLTSHLPSLSLIPTVTIMVVNLFYNSKSILPAHGFGYLIPRTISFEQNPECALGVVFDSDTVQDLDTAPGTKLTVMLGGHWWDNFVAYPDEEEGAKMAKAVLKRHLGIMKEPDLVRVNLQRECIPQYNVGHRELLSKAKEEIGNLKGRLSVIGCGYRGVGVNDCIAATRDLVSRMTFGNKSDITTGLEWVEENLEQVPIDNF